WRDGQHTPTAPARTREDRLGARLGWCLMKTITPLELQNVSDVTIIDVREPDEYAAAHVPGSVLLPLGQVVERFGELPVDRPLYLLCHSGARSGQAAEWLAAQG